MARSLPAAVAFTVESRALAAVLATAVKVIVKRTTIPILANVLISARDGRVQVSATDLDIEVTTEIPAEVETPGTITVLAAPVAEILRRIPAGTQVSLRSAEAGQAVLRAGKTRLTLHTLPAEDFPSLTGSVESRHSLRVSGERLAAMLGTVEFAISSEETRYYLNGTFLHVRDTPDGPRLRGVATDGSRLARADVEAEGLSTAMPGVIVPRKSAQELRRLAEAAGEGMVDLDISERQIRATIGDTILTSKLIDGTFPDYERVIPSANERRVQITTAEFGAALERVKVASGESRSRQVRLSLDGTTLTLMARSDATGACTEDVEVDHEGGGFEISFNGNFLSEILGQLGDAALIKLGDPGSPGLLMSREGAPALFVLMPMRG